MAIQVVARRAVEADGICHENVVDAVDLAVAVVFGREHQRYLLSVVLIVKRDRVAAGLDEAAGVVDVNRLATVDGAGVIVAKLGVGVGESVAGNGAEGHSEFGDDVFGVHVGGWSEMTLCV